MFPLASKGQITKEGMNPGQQNKRDEFRWRGQAYINHYSFGILKQKYNPTPGCIKHLKISGCFLQSFFAASVPDMGGVSCQKPNKAGFLTRQTEW